MRKKSPKTLLTIAGYDPSSGAGITADLAVFASQGCFGVSAITALTVQSTLGVRRVAAVEGSLLEEMLHCLSEDLPIAGVKIGMLGTEENVLVVARFLQQRRAQKIPVPVVLDPVLRSTSGRELLSAKGMDAMHDRLLPLVDWVTPNRAELEALTHSGAATDEGVEQRSDELRRAYPGVGVVVTGGDSGDASQASDLLMDSAGEFAWLRGEKIQSKATHGTGCAFSSALLCGLADGLPAAAAARHAKEYVSGAIRHAPGLGGGRGPMNFDWARTVIAEEDDQTKV